MKHSFLIWGALFCSLILQAQVIPFGLMMNEKGKLQQVEDINQSAYKTHVSIFSFN